MADLPLLLFPTPDNADKSKRGGGSSAVGKPTADRQWGRLSPQFQQLQDAFTAQRVQFQQTPAGIEPELVLVIETIGDVQDFANAVKKIQGLEWMGQLVGDDIAPDADFFDAEDPSKTLSAQLYLVMSNQRALEQMLSLWKQYKEDQQFKFERGLTKFRDVFLCLKDIRRWGIKERLLETGVLDAWREDLQHYPDRNVRFETELWFRGDADQRALGAQQVVGQITQLGGQIISQAIIKDIYYHAILGELPASAIGAIIANPDTTLTQCEGVMFFRPTGQMAIGVRPIEGDTGTADIGDRSMPSGEPIIALFDGVPLANHRLLDGRLRIDDPDNFESEYTAAERVHGTSMASLIVHGDLSNGEPPLTRPIYVRPIMKPVPSLNPPRREEMPRDCLAVDLIHRAVRRLFEGEDGQEPVAPHVRIINLSIGDATRPFIRMLSPLARLLDWLSVKYEVLFLVSAGNHSQEIVFDHSLGQISSFSADDLEQAVVKYAYSDMRNRRLLSPAESINALTVGAAHHDNASLPTQMNSCLNPFTCFLPSPISAFGSGYRRGIKPDLIYSGGRQLYRIGLASSPQKLEALNSRRPPGNHSAHPGVTPGDSQTTAHSCGTSNATALMSRAAGICYDSLMQVLRDHTEDDMRKFEIPLLKAMLAHGCSWGEMSERLSQILQTSYNSQDLRRIICNWAGYGVPEIERVLTCTEQRATLLGFGELQDGKAHIFKLPLPPSLGSRQDWRRLTCTLAWISPIAANTQKYRTAHLWFKLEEGSITNERCAFCSGRDGWHSVQRGTLQHEIFEGSTAEPFSDGDAISIKVSCRADAGKIVAPVAYGLAVSLEVAENLTLPIYNEIRTRIAPAIQIQQTRV
jgi:hypothetical protein